MELIWKGIDIEVLNRNKRYKQKRIKLVSNACGHAKQGLLAIMGPSGSGKTTLIQALAGRIPEGSSTTGSITLNGQERKIETWRDLVGFVDQDDTIYEKLTARETVTYAAKFRLKDKSVDINIKVNELFKRLAITHVLGCRMSNLSGGERKRVVIAIELITDPKIIFLDEPTSGLDNNTTVKMIRLLKELSEEGRTIVFTIHQPDNITVNEFDDILLLSQGRSVYMGKMANCENHLISSGFQKGSRESMSNFAMKILSVEPGVYHETAESSKLDVLVNEVKERYNFSEEEKRTKKSNDRYFNLVPDFYHTMLLLKRRFKLELFSQKNIFTLLIGFAMAGLAVYGFYKEKPAGVTRSNEDDVILAGDSKHISIDECNSYLINFSNYITYGSIFVISLPIITSMAFNAEHARVKREMAVNTYSIASYYISVLLFEFSKGLPALIAGMVGFWILQSKYVGFLFIFTLLISYLIILTGYLSIGSLFRGYKMNMSIFIVFLMLSIFASPQMIIYYRKKTEKGVLYYLGHLSGLLPTFSPSAALYAIKISQYINKLTAHYGVFKGNRRSYYEYVEKELKPGLKAYKEILTGVEIPIIFNYLFCIVLFLGYLALCIGMLSLHLRPSYRMQLNKNSRQGN